MYDFRYTLTLDDHRQIIDWQLKKNRAAPQEDAGGKKKKDNMISRIFSGLLLLWFAAAFCRMTILMVGYVGTVLVLILFLLFGIAVSTWGQRKIRLYRIKQEFKKTGGPREVHLAFTEHEIRIETGGLSQRFSYSRADFVGNRLDMAAVSGKTFVIYFPVRAVGTMEDAEELKRFVRERIGEGIHEELDLEEAAREYRKSCPYVFTFVKTREELAEFMARLTPRPFLSAAYWSGGTIVFTVAYVLFAATFLVNFYGQSGFLPCAVFFVCLTGLLTGLIIYGSSYGGKRRRLLAKEGARLDQMAGKSMAAFREDLFVIATWGELQEVRWDAISEIRGCREGIAFMMGERRYFILPGKVFETEREKQMFLDYCRKQKAKG